MRGESNENLDRQFYADTRNPVMLAERLFLIGEKARVCWTKNCFVDSDDTSLESGLQQIQQSEAYQNYGIPSMIPFSDLKNAKTFLERFGNH